MDIQVNALPVFHNMVLVWISVIILFFILKHFLYKPVNDLLQKRRALVEGEVDKAHSDLKEAQELKDAYENKLKEAKEEGVKIVEEYRRRGETMAKTIVEDAHGEAKVILDRAEREIDRRRDVAYDSIKKEAGAMAMSMAEKIIGHRLDGDDEKDALVDQLIDEMEGGHGLS